MGAGTVAGAQRYGIPLVAVAAGWSQTTRNIFASTFAVKTAGREVISCKSGPKAAENEKWYGQKGIAFWLTGEEPWA